MRWQWTCKTLIERMNDATMNVVCCPKSIASFIHHVIFFYGCFEFQRFRIELMLAKSQRFVFKLHSNGSIETKSSVQRTRKRKMRFEHISHINSIKLNRFLLILRSVGRWLSKVLPFYSQKKEATFLRKPQFIRFGRLVFYSFSFGFTIFYNFKCQSIRASVDEFLPLVLVFFFFFFFFIDMNFVRLFRRIKFIEIFIRIQIETSLKD